MVNGYLSQMGEISLVAEERDERQPRGLHQRRSHPRHLRLRRSLRLRISLCKVVQVEFTSEIKSVS